MKDIDWSKAPEGATHWDSRGNCCSVGFMRPGVRRGEWEYFGMDGHWILYGPVDGALEAAMVKRPDDTSWVGEGLPPVGAVCEVLNNELNNPVWETCTILWVGKYRVIYDSESCNERVGFIEDLEFRAHRTPEQIAADEREKEVNRMVATAQMLDKGWARKVCESLYDAGYRKVAP